MQVVVGPGLYAVMAESPERAGLPVAVLTVTP
jgi:hypothetical protein